MPRPTDEKAKTCATCWFWEPLQSEYGDSIEFVKHQGRCRIGPPISSGEWPETNGEDWCGEFRRGLPCRQTT